jgi:hypothetical protein
MCCRRWKAITPARRRPQVPHGGLEILANIEASTIRQKYTVRTLCNGEKVGLTEERQGVKLAISRN